MNDIVVYTHLLLITSISEGKYAKVIGISLSIILTTALFDLINSIKSEENSIRMTSNVLP